MIRKLCSVGVLALFSLAGISQAHAVASECSEFNPDVTGYVTGTSACEIDPDITNDSPEGQFLAGDWFGYDDWTQDAKDNDLDGVDEGDKTLGFSVDGDREAGSWSFSESLAGLDVMLVFKDGEQANPNGLVSYLVNDTSGTYLSMFTNDSEQTQQISHVSVWLRGDSVEVPAPAMLGLIGIGLLGMLAVGRRRM